jgi:uncharacterized protein YjiS (DUF1127 family)
MALVDDFKYAHTGSNSKNTAVAKSTVVGKFRPAHLITMMKNFWRTRQHIKQLSNLSDETLRDIGLTQNDVQALGVKAWHQEPGTWLESTKQRHINEERLRASARLRCL